MKLLNIKNLIYFLVLAIVVYAILISLGDIGKISIASFDWMVIPFILLFAFLDDFIRFFKWDYFLKKIDVKIPKRTSFLIFFSGLAMSITPAKVGEVLKSYLLKKTNGIEMRRSIPVVVLERLTDVLGLAILALFGSFAFIESLYYQVIIIVLIAGLIIATALLTNRKIFFKASSVLLKMPVIKNYVKYVADMYENSQNLLKFKPIFIATLMSVVSWFCECFAFYLLLNILGINFSIMGSSFVFAFSSVFGNAIPIPGGLGATEGSLVGLLLLNGVELSLATLATVVIRVCTLFWGISIGIICLLLISRKIKGGDDNESEGTYRETEKL